MINIKGMTIKEAHEGLTNRKFSAVELAEKTLKVIKKEDKEIHAYLELDEAGAIKTAKEVDKDIKEEKKLDTVSGIPIVLKDNILFEGLKTTAGSQILKDYTASYDATVSKKLREKNAVVIGKTNLDEFAMGSSTENSSFGPTKNPCDKSRVPGGSSGGSAAAVAADLAVAALGTDTGGSIRQPGAFCGVVGLKPTYGAVSRFGLIALASSLDQAGPITKTVEDSAILFNAMRGYDSFDSTSSDTEYDEKELLNPNLKRIKGLTVGIPEEYFIDGISEEVGRGVESAIRSIEELGIKTKKISLPHTKYALSVYYIVMPAEASTNLARYDGIRYGTQGTSQGLRELYENNRGEGFGAEVKRRIILGTFALSAGYYDAYYDKAQRVRALIKEDFDKAFKSVDVILSPTTPTTAFKFGEKKNPLDMYLSDIFTIPANLAGIPAISIPVKENGAKLPVGFQLMGRHFREADILGIGQFYERL